MLRSMHCDTPDTMFVCLKESDNFACSKLGNNGEVVHEMDQMCACVVTN